jgi:integrase
MESENQIEKSNLPGICESQDRYVSQTAVSENSDADASQVASSVRPTANLLHLKNPELQATLVMSESCAEQEPPAEYSSMTLADFVQHRFIPEYVATRRSTGRAHFRAILKHVFKPEQVDRVFADDSAKAAVKLKAIDGWPYMDSQRLCDISGERIQHLISTALQSGYSIQTATHIRNVIRAIFTHAIMARCYTGTNPTTLVTLPAMARKVAHTLTLTELKQVMLAMRYPEKGIALFAILTEMNVAEICGLQWKYVNLSDVGHMVEDDWIPSRTIAVRKQWHRGEFGPVFGKRKRLVPVPEALCLILRDLRNRKHFTGSQDFVLASRSGTPFYPQNIAARRLKAIGRKLEMPWLSWNVFHRTHLNLRSEFGRQLHKEYERALPLQKLVIHESPTLTFRTQ